MGDLLLQLRVALGVVAFEQQHFATAGLQCATSIAEGMERTKLVQRRVNGPTGVCPRRPRSPSLYLPSDCSSLPSMMTGTMPTRRPYSWKKKRGSPSLHFAAASDSLCQARMWRQDQVGLWGAKDRLCSPRIMKVKRCKASKVQSCAVRCSIAFMDG